MSSAQGDTFSPHNLSVLGGLLLIALILGEVIFPRPKDGDKTAMQGVGSMEDVAMRLKPVVTLDDIMDNMSLASTASSDSGKTPKQLYTGACLACHASGVAGAPKLGDNVAWASRATSGIDSLVAAALNGKGAMPAKGGSSYSEDQIRVVVEYMLAESGQ